MVDHGVPDGAGLLVARFAGQYDTTTDGCCECVARRRIEFSVAAIERAKRWLGHVTAIAAGRERHLIFVGDASGRLNGVTRTRYSPGARALPCAVFSARVHDVATRNQFFEWAFISQH